MVAMTMTPFIIINDNNHREGIRLVPHPCVAGNLVLRPPVTQMHGHKALRVEGTAQERHPRALAGKLGPTAHNNHLPQFASTAALLVSVRPPEACFSPESSGWIMNRT